MERAYRRPETLEEERTAGSVERSVSFIIGGARAAAGRGGRCVGRGTKSAAGKFSASRVSVRAQEAVIEALLDGRHALTVMPTGSGKSLCFQIPALVHGRTHGGGVPPDRADAGPGVRAQDWRASRLTASTPPTTGAPTSRAWRRAAEGRDAASLHGARASDDGAHAVGARPPSGQALRHRRGSLQSRSGALPSGRNTRTSAGCAICSPASQSRR